MAILQSSMWISFYSRIYSIKKIVDMIEICLEEILSDGIRTHFMGNPARIVNQNMKFHAKALMKRVFVQSST